MARHWVVKADWMGLAGACRLGRSRPADLELVLLVLALDLGAVVLLVDLLELIHPTQI